MKFRIALFGGTGFIGSYVLNKLLEQGFLVNLLVRDGSEHKHPENHENLTLIKGNATNESDQMATLYNADCVIYLIGLIREFPSKGITFNSLHYKAPMQLIKLSEKLGLKKYIYMSANGIKPDGTLYQTTKYNAEKKLKKSSLNYTIFRPSIVFGDPNGKTEFCTQLKNDLICQPLPLPLFFEGFSIKYAGQFLMSPIHVNNVSEIIVKSIRDEKSNGKTYLLGGENNFSWKEIIQIISKVLNRKKILLPAPAEIVKLVAGLFSRWDWFPITKDQITMLLEGNVCDCSDTFAHFEIKPKKFCAEEWAYLKD